MIDQSISSWMTPLIRARFFAKSVTAQPGFRGDSWLDWKPAQRGPSINVGGERTSAFEIKRSRPSANFRAKVAMVLLDSIPASIVHLATTTHATNTGNYSKLELFAPSLLFEDRFELAALCCNPTPTWTKTEHCEGVVDISVRNTEGGAVHNTYVYDARTLTMFVHVATKTALVVHENYVDTST